MGTLVYSNRIKDLAVRAGVDLENDTIKVILMASGFVFDPDTHDNLAAVTASQLATGNGYTQDTETLANVAVARDNANDRVDVTADDIVWTASGGSIGPAAGAIFYNDTEAADAVIAYDPFAAELTATDGNTLTISNVILRLS